MKNLYTNLPAANNPSPAVNAFAQFTKKQNFMQKINTPGKRIILVALLLLGITGFMNATAGITFLQDWTNLHHSTASPGNLTYTVNAGTNTNRILIVAISSSTSAAAARTVSITYRGQAPTSSSGDIGGGNVQHTQIYYFNEAALDAGTGTTLAITISGGTTTMTDVWVAVLDGVDQTNPITNTQNYNSGTNAVDPFQFATGLTVNTNDQAIEIISTVRTGSTSPRSISSYAANWTSGAAEQTGNYNPSGTTNDQGIRNAVANRDIPASNTTDVSSINLSGGARASMTAYSFKAAPPTITLSSPSQVTAGNLSKGSVDNHLSRFQAAVTIADATLNSIGFTSAGTCTTSDLVNYKLYYNTTSTFPGGTPLASMTTTGAGAHTFSGLTQVISSGTTGYFWITTDVNATAITGRTVNIAASPTLTFASGTPTGTITIGGTQTILASPNIAISSPNPAVPAGNIIQNTTNDVIYRFDNAVTVSNAIMSGLTITTAGTYTATDITNLKAWYSSDNTFSAATDIWIWDDSGSGNYRTGNSGGTYGTGISRYIAPMQGFFVKADSLVTGGTFKMTNNVRAHSTQSWVKSDVIQNNILRLKLSTEQNTYWDEMIVDFNSSYTGDEGSPKLASWYTSAPEIWSLKNGKKYTFDRYKEISSALEVNVNVKCGVSGPYTISATNINEFDLSNIVYLEDLKTGNKVNLKETGSYSFTGGPNDNKARFRITFAEITGTDVPEISKPVYIYSFGKDVYVNASSLTTGNCDVYIYDAPGRLVYNGKYTPVVGNHKFATLQTPGAYVVKVISHTGTTTAKIIIP